MKVKRWKNIHHANINQKKSIVAIFISGQIYIRAKQFKRDSNNKYSIHQKDSNPNCMQQITELKICATKTDRIERKNRQIYNYS